MKPDDKVCFCFHVSLRKLVNFIGREHPQVASQISECLSAGTGCGWCVPFLRKLHRDVESGNTAWLDKLDFDDYEKLRSGWLGEKSPDRDLDTFADEVLAGREKELEVGETE